MVTKWTDNCKFRALSIALKTKYLTKHCVVTKFV